MRGCSHSKPYSPSVAAQDSGFTGEVQRAANEPQLPGLRFMERTTFHPSQFTDWMYIEDGFLVGGFITRVIRAGMSPEERKEYDSHAPYKFRDCPNWS